ncbi:MAG TPA: DUF4232 domain-containing protein [Acidimicrobiales bacterium]|nr:DUF4232 domain-containing protein [Acidimicrobiales bacterium]
MNGRRSGLLAGVVVVGAVLLAACSSGGGSTATTTTTNGHGTTTTAATGSTTTTAATGSTTTGGNTTTSTAAGVSTCQPAQLRIVPQQGTGAAGTITMTVSLTNVSSTTCTLQGYPGMQLLTASGSSLPTQVVRGGTQFPAAAANQSPALVTLAPQQGATFSLAYEDVPVGNETTCPTSAKAEITPPNDVGHGVITLAISPCNGGTVHVSPVYAGS